VPAENVRRAKPRAIPDGQRIDPAFANATVAENCHLTIWNPRLLRLRARGFAPLTRIDHNCRESYSVAPRSKVNGASLSTTSDSEYREDTTLMGILDGKVAIITGGTSGIGARSVVSVAAAPRGCDG
jgi:hypothetical protein